MICKKYATPLQITGLLILSHLMGAFASGTSVVWGSNKTGLLEGKGRKGGHTAGPSQRIKGAKKKGRSISVA